jgi:hypothetical protein
MHVIERTIAIGDDRQQMRAIFGRRGTLTVCAMPTSVNRAIASVQRTALNPFRFAHDARVARAKYLDSLRNVEAQGLLFDRRANSRLSLCAASLDQRGRHQVKRIGLKRPSVDHLI